ncbi:hypothetical protein [Herbiconiux liangxiaofengii]|uniref:hypothetical protein n=1 Tax=Herbiconiux liangxiaofengii TaxID=3342795 RepID=UPI0035B9B9B5
MAARDARNDEAFEDFLWEIDVTRRRPAPGPARDLSAAPSAQPRPPAPATGRTPRFARPELTTRRERFTSSLVVQATAGGLLVGGTAALVAFALIR